MADLPNYLHQLLHDVNTRRTRDWAPEFIQKGLKLGKFLESEVLHGNIEDPDGTLANAHAEFIRRALVNPWISKEGYWEILRSVRNQDQDNSIDLKSIQILIKPFAEQDILASISSSLLSHAQLLSSTFTNSQAIALQHEFSYRLRPNTAARTAAAHVLAETIERLSEQEISNKIDNVIKDVGEASLEILLITQTFDAPHAILSDYILKIPAIKLYNQNPYLLANASSNNNTLAKEYIAWLRRMKTVRIGSRNMQSSEIEERLQCLLIFGGERVAVLVREAGLSN